MSSLINKFDSFARNLLCSFWSSAANCNFSVTLNIGRERIIPKNDLHALQCVSLNAILIWNSCFFLVHRSLSFDMQIASLLLLEPSMHNSSTCRFMRAIFFCYLRTRKYFFFQIKIVGAISKNFLSNSKHFVATITISRS